MSKNPASDEYCHGYVDKNGIWNNGFYCRRWGGHDITYCCGDGLDRFCCPELPHLVTPATGGNSPLPAENSFNYIPVVIGVSVVVITIFVAALTVALCCYFCACCPARRRQRLRMQSSAFVVNGTLPFCTEAEATSSVIAAEALQMPIRDFSVSASARFTGGTPHAAATSGGQRSPRPTFDQRTRCADPTTRAWSPMTTTQDIPDELDSTATSTLSRKRDIGQVSWHTELQNQCSCEYQPILTLEPRRNERSKVLVSSTGSPIAFKQSTGCPSSAWKLDPFGANRQPPIRSEDRGLLGDEAPPLAKRTALEPSNQRSCPFTAADVIVSTTSSAPQGRWQSKLRPAVTLTKDVEGHRRDSGVLVEEQDASDNSGSPVCGGRGGGGGGGVLTWKSNS